MKVFLTPRARSDLTDIYEFIATDSVRSAGQFISQLLHSVYQLGKFPLMGRIIRKFNDPNIRELLYKNYRIAYRIKNEVIEILTIRHIARDSKY